MNFWACRFWVVHGRQELISIPKKAHWIFKFFESYIYLDFLWLLFTFDLPAILKEFFDLNRRRRIMGVFAKHLVHLTFVIFRFRRLLSLFFKLVYVTSKFLFCFYYILIDWFRRQRFIKWPISFGVPVILYLYWHI